MDDNTLVRRVYNSLYCDMFPILDMVSQFAFDQSIDRFSAKVEIQVPPDIAHVSANTGEIRPGGTCTKSY
jgi:hypothetical protein